MAGRAGLLADVALEPRLGVLVRGLDIALVEDVAHTGILGEPMRIAAVLRVIVHAHLLVAQAVEEHLLHALRQVAPRRGGVDLEVLGECAEDLRVIVRLAEEASEHPLLDGKARILDKRFGVHDLLETETVALGASAIGSVERKIARLQVVDGMPMLRARERKGVHEELALRAFRSVAIGQQVDPHAAMGERRSLLDSLGNAPRAPLADHDAVDHDLDGMPELLIEFDGVVEGADLAVDAHA